MKHLRCALYPRVSTEEQFIHGLSLPAQIKDLTDYATRMNYHIVDVYADEGVSARKPVSKRPALLRLLKDVQDDKIDIILVTKLDRWFRSIKEYQLTQEILEKHNCYWKTIFEDYDTSTANGQMVVNIMLAVAQNECDRTSERIKVVLEHKVRNGEHITGAAPYGYISVNKKLQKDPETSAVVDDIFRFYFSCFSKRKTIYYIADKYKDHPKKPSKYQMNRILSSDLYAGIYREFDHYHPAYITKEQLHLIKHTTDSKRYPRTKEAYLFSGLIRCPVCSAILTGYRKKYTRKDGAVTTCKRYRCCRKFDTHSSPCISESAAETYMLEHLGLPLSVILCRVEHPSAKPSRKMPEIRAEMERLNLLFQKGRITDAYYDCQYEKLEAALQKEQENNFETPPQKEQALPKVFSGNWMELYEKLDCAHKNAFWKQIIREIRVDKDTHKICGFVTVQTR